MKPPRTGGFVSLNYNWSAIDAQETFPGSFAGVPDHDTPTEFGVTANDTELSLSVRC